MRPVLGVIILEADHSVETLELADPYGWEAPAQLNPGFFGHPATWPTPTVFAIAAGATAGAAADGDPAAMRGVAAAVERLDGRCDLILGGCGFFARAWDYIDRPPTTPALLSGLDLLGVALASTRRDVAVISFSDGPGRRFVEERGVADRVRVLGISPAGDWPLIGRSDWATAPAWTVDGLVAGLRETLANACSPGGTLDGVGGIILECTILPQFRSIITEYTNAPVYDAGSMALGMLGIGGTLG